MGYTELALKVTDRLVSKCGYERADIARSLVVRIVWDSELTAGDRGFKFSETTGYLSSCINWDEIF